MYLRKFVVGLMLWCITLVAFAENAGPITHEKMLDNGLKIIVREDHRAPIVVHQIWYKVGGSDEHNGMTGISHALEHMMFKGTPDYPDNFSKIISENGGKHNAWTALDYTLYYQEIEKSQLPLCFKLEADRMQNLLLSEAEFLKEIQVVMEERRLRIEDNPEAMARERFFSVAHLNNPHQNPVIGWMGDIQNLKISDLKQWYETWYSPNNAFIVVVGDVNPKEVFEQAQKDFGHLKAKSLPESRPSAEEIPLGERRVNVHLKNKVPYLLMGYNTPIISNASEPWEPYALIMLQAILDGGTSSRFTSQLIREQAVASKIYSWYYPFQRYSGLFGIAAHPQEGQTLATLENAILNQIKHLQQNTITEEELSMAKTIIKAAYLFQQDSMETQAKEIGILEASGLPLKLYDEFLDKIDAVTPAHIQMVTNKYLSTDRLTVTQLIPLKNEI